MRMLAAALGRSDVNALCERLFRAAVQATVDFFEADRASVKLLFSDAYALGGRFDCQRRGGVRAGRAGRPVSASGAGDPPWPDVAAADVADFVVSLVLDGMRPRDSICPGRGVR